jgi:heptosyltransferase III
VESVLEGLPRESRVAVVRLRSLGDCVLTTPALQILKRARPDLRVAVVVENRFRAVFEGNPDVESILPPQLGALRGWRPRLCLNLHGGTRSAWMTALSGARLRAGFGHFRHGAAYNVRIPRAQEILGVTRKVHTAEHLASAMFYLGAPVGEIPRARLAAAGSRDEERDQGVARGRGRPPHFAVLHPVAATLEKSWPAEGFLKVARHLRQSGLDPVFIGGPGDDLSAFAEFRTLGGAPLSDIKNLLAGASLFIGNDSGPAHMAAAFGLPVVVVFGASDPEIWGPWRTASEVISAPSGIAQVQPAQVIEALARLRVAA